MQTSVGHVEEEKQFQEARRTWMCLLQPLHPMESRCWPASSSVEAYILQMNWYVSAGRGSHRLLAAVSWNMLRCIFKESAARIQVWTNCPQRGLCVLSLLRWLRLLLPVSMAFHWNKFVPTDSWSNQLRSVWSCAKRLQTDGRWNEYKPNLEQRLLGFSMELTYFALAADPTRLRSLWSCEACCFTAS